VNEKLLLDLAHALRRQRPTEGCHCGRGFIHGEHCFHTCLHSWEGMVAEIEGALSQQPIGFNRYGWSDYVKGKSEAPSRGFLETSL